MKNILACHQTLLKNPSKRQVTQFEYTPVHYVHYKSCFFILIFVWYVKEVNKERKFPCNGCCLQFKGRKLQRNAIDLSQSNLNKSNAQKFVGTCQIWPNNSNSNFCKQPHLLPDILIGQFEILGQIWQEFEFFWNNEHLWITHV